MAFDVGQLINKRYRILQTLSLGGMGTTYLAEDTFSGERVAIEVTPVRYAPDPRERLLLTGLRSPGHSNILLPLEYGEAPGITYVVYPYFPHGTLRDRYPRGTLVPLPTVVEYVGQIADALQYAHDHRIVHRDVKPENMLLRSDGKVLLTDFGIADIIHPNLLSSPIGTAPYMAPEQFVGKTTSKSDQYSLAVIVYEWLTGHTPFQGSPNELAYQHLHAPPPSLRELDPSIPSSVEQVVLKALEKERTNRFPTVMAFAQAFAQASKSTEEERRPFHMQLRYERERRGWSQADIAKKLACDVKTVARWERGKGFPRPYHQRALSRLFDKKAETLGLLEDKPLQALQNTGALENWYDSAIEDFITGDDDSVKNILPSHSIEKQPGIQLSLYALAHAELETDDRALIGKTYTLEAGIAQQKPENFEGEPFQVTVHDPSEPLLFHIMIHTSPNIELLGDWYQSLRYSPLNAEPQLITCPFRLTAAGESYLLVNFYRERQWLKSIRLEFEGIEQARFSNAAHRG